MAVVIRLQGLPVVAGSADIRHFFSGLQIPDGGVHIVGGKHGEAFILFGTDEDARCAMSRSGGLIKKSSIQLYLSSKAEMQSTVENNRKGERGPIPGSRGSGVPGVGNLSNLVAAIRKGISTGLNANGTRRTNAGVPKTNYGGDRMAEIQPSTGLYYLNLTGMPYTATEEDVRAFFHGLHVDNMILMELPDGRKSGNGLVKFASEKDTVEGLKRHKQYIGSRFINVTVSNEEEWVKCGGRVTYHQKPPRFRSRERSPPREQPYSKHRSDSKSPPRKQRMRSRSPPNHEFYIHMKNLPSGTEKRDVRRLFKNFDVTDTQIKMMQAKFNTMNAFVLFKNESDYNRALGFHKLVFNDQRIYVYPISRKAMLELIEAQEALERKQSSGVERPRDDLPETRFDGSYSNSRICIYTRNFPFDVTKVEVQKFFVGFDVREDDIYLLTDEKGVGLGEALVKFASEEQARNAESLDRRRFLGTEVLLRRISEKQMEEFGLKAYSGLAKSKDCMPLYGRDDFSRSVDVHGPPDFRRGPEEFLSPIANFRDPPPYLDFQKADSFARLRVGRHPEGRLPEEGIRDFAGGVTKIRLTNVPFKATVNEILDFFYGYRVIPESVTIPYTKQGLPTGIAVVALESYEEAISAINELNDRPIGPRKVGLSLLSAPEFIRP